MRIRDTLAILIAALLGGIAAFAHAESKRFGEYEVIYSVVGTRFLQPGIAASYGIAQADDRALINVALQRRVNGVAEPVGARVSGEHGDLIRKQPVVFREVREPQAIYYLAEFGFRDGEATYFTLSVAPEGDTATLEVQFSKTLFED